jgi:hypothetical protein
LRPGKREEKADAKEKGVSSLGEADLAPRTDTLFGGLCCENDKDAVKSMVF